MKRRKASIHYGYWIVAAFVVISFGPLSFGLSCAGLFFTPAATEFSSNSGVMSYYISFIWIASIISLPVLGKILKTQDVRIFISSAVVIMAAALALQSITQAVWQYLACGLAMGISITMLLFLAPSTIINRWFSVRSGFFVGLVMAFTGVGGMVWNVVGGILINSAGWRFTLLIFAGLVLLFGLPCGLFVVRSGPEDKGLLPYGADKVSNDTVPELANDIEARVAFKSSSFILLCAFAFLLNFGMYAYQIIPSYMSSLPLSLSLPLLGATAASVAMGGQTVGKLILGATGEKKPGLVIACAIALGIIGILVLIVFQAVPVALYCGAALYGVYYALTNVMLPIMTRRFFGIRDYSVIYARVSMAASLGATVAAFAWGTVVKEFGFEPMLFGIVICLAISAFVALGALSKGTCTENKRGLLSASDAE